MPLKISTATSGFARRKSAIRSTPFPSGSPRSKITTSNSSIAGWLRASASEPACATSSMSDCPLNRASMRPRATPSLSPRAATDPPYRGGRSIPMTKRRYNLLTTYIKILHMNPCNTYRKPPKGASQTRWRPGEWRARDERRSSAEPVQAGRQRRTPPSGAASFALPCGTWGGDGRRPAGTRTGWVTPRRGRTGGWTLILRWIPLSGRSK